MVVRFLHLVLIAFAFSAQAAMANTRGAESLVERAAPEAAFSRSHALVVGIDAYSNGWRPLDNAVADAHAVAEALEAAGFEVRLVADPSRSALVDEIEAFVYGPGSDPDARLLFWFAGHGHTVDDTGYLVPPEAPLPGTGRVEDAEFRRVALSLRRLDAEYLREVRARHVLAVFDACFAGTIFNGTRSAGVPPAIRHASANPVVQLITSGQAGEEVRDDGLFRKLFVDALTGRDRRMLTEDGYLLGSRLGNFLAEIVPDLSGGFQHPAHGKLRVLGRDRGDFVFPVRYVEDDVAVASAAASAAQPVVDARPAPELRILPPEAEGEEAAAAFIAQKLSRNLVELLAEAGLPVSNDQTTRSGGREPSHLLRTHVSVFDSEAFIHIELQDGRRAAQAAATFSGPAAFWRRHYKVLPETALYALDVSPVSLAPLHTARRPTREPLAYAKFLAARDRVALRRYEEGLELLQAAIEEVDPGFAAGYGAMAEIARLGLGDEEAAGRHQQAALALDPDFPRLAVFAPQLLGDPLPQLRTAGHAAAWEALADGLEQRMVTAADYDVTVHAWRFDPQRFRLALGVADNAFGNTAEEFRAGHDAVLAINAGFFDLDLQSRLSPVGLAVADGRELHPFDAEKAVSPLSGVLHSIDGRLSIDFAREYDTARPVEMALQSGPLVVDPGGQNGIRRNSYDRLNRSAVCLTEDGAPVVVLVWGGLSLFELGAFLSTPAADGGLGCERAINLDGGPSSQSSLRLPGHAYEIPGLWRVNSALLVVPKDGEARP